MRKTDDQRLAEAKRLRFSDPQRVTEICQDLASEALEEKNYNLCGVAEFLCGDAYYTLADPDNCLTHLHQASEFLNQAENWQKLGECYVLMGMLLENQGDNSSAFNSFHAAMEVLQDNPDHYFLGAQVFENYSELCDRMGSLEDGLYYAKKSLNYSVKITDPTAYYYATGIVLAELVLFDVRLNNLKEAKHYLDQLDELHRAKLNITESDEFTVFEDSKFNEEVARFIYYHEAGEKDAARIHFEEISRLFHRSDYGIDYFWISIILLQFLYDKGCLRLMKEIINGMSERLNGKGMAGLQIKLSRLKLNLYDQEGDFKSVYKEMKTYLHYTDINQQNENHILHLLRGLDDDLYHYRKNNQKLLEQVNTDELTGLNNRRKYDEISYKKLNECLEEDKPFGIELLDIDRFKSINDNHGHKTGDECLMLLADALANIETENVTAFRYGGDEFVVLYVGMTDKEIKGVADRIRDNVQEILKESRMPNFTVSQGIVNGIPCANNRIWDFVTCADNTMYNVKSKGGDSYKMAHLRTAEVVSG